MWKRLAWTCIALLILLPQACDSSAPRTSVGPSTAGTAGLLEAGSAGEAERGDSAGMGGNSGEAGAAGPNEAGSAGEAGSLFGTGGTGAAGGSSGSAGANAIAGSGGGGAPPTAGCVKALYGTYIARTDGALLAQVITGLAYSERAVLDDATGLPVESPTSVQDGNAHGCATLAGSDAAWCWRTDQFTGNREGQLGNGAIDGSGPVYRATRVLTAPNTPLTHVASIADGPGNTACAVTTDGNLYCWGQLNYIANSILPCAKGSCGTPDVVSAYAVRITTNGTTPLSNVVQAVVHGVYACAILKPSANEEVRCWGQDGDDGNLGLGVSLNLQYPTAVVPGLTNPRKLVIHDYNGIYGVTCALEGDRVRCWGPNNGGNAGIGNTTTPVTSPTLVVGSDLSTPLDGVVDLSGGPLAGGIASFCAVRTDHTLWCWPGLGNKFYASDIGATGVYFAGRAQNVEYVTSDGVYHIGNDTVTVNCGAL